MKTITVQFVAEDGFKAEAINEDLQRCGVLNDHPVLCWTTEDSTPEQEEWLRREYLEEELED